MVSLTRFLVCGLLVAPVCFCTRAAHGQQVPAKEGPKDISFYREFLVQAEMALREKDGAETARGILDLCPKEYRHFEWHYLNRKAQPDGFTFKGHTGSVNAVAFSPDGKTLASGGNDNLIKLWDLTTGKDRLTLEGHKEYVNCLAFHPTGKFLASGSWDKTIKLWDPVTGKTLSTLAHHKYSVNGVAFSPDGAWLASFGGDRVIHIYDLAKSKTKKTWEYPDAISCLTFSRDGKYLAAAGADRVIWLYSVPDFRLITKLVGHERRVTSLAFHADLKRLFSMDLDGIRIWDLHEEKQLKAITDRQAAVIPVLALNSQGTTLATLATEGRAKVWYEPLDKPTREIRRSGGWKSFVAFHPNGQTLALEGPDNSIKLYETGEQTLQIQAPEPIWSVHPAKDHFLVSMRKGAIAISVAADGTEGRRELKGHTGQVRAVCYQPQGKLMASAGLDRVIKIFDRKADKELHSLVGHKGMIRHLAFSPDGKRLASASSDKTIKLWDPVAGKEVLTLKGHKGSATSVVFLPGDKLASSSVDGSIKLWNAANGKNLQTWAAHEDMVSHLALTPDGKRLASAGTDGKIKIWSLATGKTIHTLDVQASMVQALAFSPDGKRLATGSMGGGVTLWDPDSGQQVYTFPRLTGPVNAVAFSPDGQTLFSGSYDGTVMLWKARPVE